MTSISPIQPPMYQPVQQPNYNAVKIDINNPQVNATPNYAQPMQMQPIQQQQANYAPVYSSVPTASVYEMPQQSIYKPQAVKPANAIPEAASVPPPVIIQPSIKPPVQMQQIQQQIPQAPQVEASTQATAPIGAVAAVAPKTIDIKPSEPVKPQLDLNEFITKLTSPDYEVQAKTIESIAGLAQNSPQLATELLDVKVIESLLGVVNKDSSKLQGPTAQQRQIREKIMDGKKVSEAENAEANKISPMELAERNKMFSIYTIAILDKLYASEVEKIDKTVVPLTELPGAAGVVEQIKTNPNPMIKIAAIDALSFIQRPEYKKDLTTILNVAKGDKNPNVQKVADSALKKLEQVPAPALKNNKN